MKNLIFIALIMTSANLIVGQNAWDVDTTLIKTISINDTITYQINFESDLEVQGNKFSDACDAGIELTVIRISDNQLVFKYCSQIDTFKFDPFEVKIINAKNYFIAFNKGEDIRAPVDRSQSSTNERNIYEDAYTIWKGDEVQQSQIFDIWNIKQSTSEYFKKEDFVSLQSAVGEYKALDKYSGISGFNATRIADGFAKFLVSRVKKEMAISFFNNIKEKISDDKYGDAQTMFSTTHSTLDLIDENIYDLDTYLPALKQSFEYDVEKLPNTFSSVIKDSTSQISKFLDVQNEATRFTISSILDFGIEIKAEKHIGRALADWDLQDNPTSDKANQNYMASLQTLQLFSEAMRDTFQSTEEPYWLSQEKLDLLITNPDFLKCFVGLITEKAKNEKITFKNNKSLADLLTASVNNLDNILSIITSFNKVSKNINQINNSEIARLSDDDKRIAYVEYFQLADKIISVIEPINEFTKMIDPEIVKQILKLSTQTVGLAKGIASKQYGIGLLHLSNILSQVSNNKGVLKPILTFVGREGMFIAQIAEAEDSDQVSAIIENFAAPVGSWRDKRTAKWNLSFDSYVGAGAYFMDKDDDSMPKGTVATPIGFSLTSPLLSNNFTIMASIIDLGPIVAFRFLDKDTDISDIFLREIIAPGLFLSWNIDNTFQKDFLLKVNVGYQQFPLLDEVNTASNTVSLTNESGFAASINVNVPILTLVNKKK